MIPMFSDAIAMARLDELRRESKQWRLARLARASPGAEGSRKPAAPTDLVGHGLSVPQRSH